MRITIQASLYWLDWLSSRTSLSKLDICSFNIEKSLCRIRIAKAYIAIAGIMTVGLALAVIGYVEETPLLCKSYETSFI
jgi:hypothetical protein